MTDEEIVKNIMKSKRVDKLIKIMNIEKKIKYVFYKILKKKINELDDFEKNIIINELNENEKKYIKKEVVDNYKIY